MTFDKSEEYNRQIKKYVQKIKKACIDCNVPFFFAACVQNDENGSQYEMDSFSALSGDMHLTEDFFPEFMKVTLGFKADIPRPSPEFIFDDEEDG